MSKINADKLARYIIYYGDIKGTNITMSKLQKLLFFIQKEYIKQTGELLFNEEFEAWEYGPIIPSIYFAYCANGTLSLYCYDEGDGDADLTETDIQIVNSVLDEKMNYNFPRLSKESRAEKVWRDHVSEEPWYRVIKNEELLKAYT